MTEPRFCAWVECAKPLGQRENESPSDYERRRTCSVSCGSKLGHLERKQRLGEIASAKVSRELIGSVPSWPKVTGDWPKRWEKTKPFARDTIVEPASRPVFRALPADSRSLIGCSAAMVVRAAQ